MARFEMEYAGMAGAPKVRPDAEALFELGIAYATGENVEADLVVAHKWFNLAALAGSEEAADHRQDLAMEMSVAEIARAQRAAREWLATFH